MKVSFSISSSKETSKPSNRTSDQHDESSNKEFSTEFDPSKTLTCSTCKNPIVIPPIPNQWNPQSHPKIDDLNIRTEPDLNPNSSCESNGKKGCGSDPVSAIDRLMLMRLRSDLQRLPADRGLKEFEDVSVEEFGRAYLKGYGWSEGRRIGKNAKEDVKVVQYTKRVAREGLGFAPTGDLYRKAAESKNCVM